MKTLLVIVALVMSACGGTPTGPTTTTSTSTSTVSAPEPTAPQPEPTPEPEPSPAPLPVPPQHEPVWTGTTEHGTALPASFPVEWRYDTLWFGPLTATIMLQDSRSIFARTETYSIQIVLNGDTGVWTFNGLAGQASGSLVLR